MAKTPLFTIGNDDQAIRQGQLVLCAASSPIPFLKADHFQEAAVICDIAVPGNIVSGLSSERPDLLTLQGGIVATPIWGKPARRRAGISERRAVICLHGRNGGVGIVGF